MKKLLYILLPVLFVGSIVVSCNKENAQNIIGEWELISKPNENYEYKWVFNESKVTLLATDVEELFDGAFDTCTVGHYVIKNGVLTIAAETLWCSYMTYTGDWDIQKLDQSHMTIRRESDQGTIWYEFVKSTD